MQTLATHSRLGTPTTLPLKLLISYFSYNMPTCVGNTLAARHHRRTDAASKHEDEKHAVGAQGHLDDPPCPALRRPAHATRY